MREMALVGGTAMGNVNGADSDDSTLVPGVAFLEDSDCALIMKFDTLTPVAGPYASSANAVRGIAGGGLPWVMESGSGSLSRDGHLLVRIRGLVLASDPSVPASMRGTNPFPAFRAVVSCLSIGPDGAAAITNVSTGDFDATSSGDADIDARVSLPQPCIAPIVLVTGPSGAESWFAVTGR
jgi:hypothetical protein